MLRLSKLADYGTVVMVYLARHADVLCNARDIAARTHLSLPTVSKLLKRLTSAGLLMSTRGVAGGYRMQRPAAEIFITDIIYALDEDRGLTECSMHPNACSLHGFCHVEGNWQLISRTIASALSSVSLEALAEPSLSQVALERIQQIGAKLRHG